MGRSHEQNHTSHDVIPNRAEGPVRNLLFFNPIANSDSTAAA